MSLLTRRSWLGLAAAVPPAWALPRPVEAQSVRRPVVANGRRHLQYDVFTETPLVDDGVIAAGRREIPFGLGIGPGTDGATVYSRMMGANEDPATGSASGPLGCYLVKHGLVPAEKAGAIVSVQGVKMGRPSRIHVKLDMSGADITRVRVGGTSVLVGKGRLRAS